MARWHRPTGQDGVRFVAATIGVLADVAIGVSLARAGTRVSSASVSSATTGSALVALAEIGHRQTATVGAPRSAVTTLRSSAVAVGWSGLAWSSATLAADRNLPKAPLGPALAALQGLTLVSGSTWPNRVASGIAQVSTGVIMSGAAARHEDPTASAIALTSSGLLALARITGVWQRDALRTTSSVLDAGGRVVMAVAAGRLAAVGDERLF